MKKKGLLTPILLAVILLTSLASAHQPRVVFDKDLSTNAMTINNPEISQAFYGQLKGGSHNYKISSDKSFELYLNILSPGIKDAKKDFSVQVFKEGREIALLNASSTQWKNFYEEYAGDNYWTGPEFDQNETSGTYIIEVSNPSNEGKYVLAAGKIESFPAKDMLKMLSSLYNIKTGFFGKSAFSIFEGKIGRYLLYSVILILLIISLAVWITTKIFRRKKKVTKKSKQLNKRILSKE